MKAPDAQTNRDIAPAGAGEDNSISNRSPDLRLVKRALDGDETAIRTFRDRYDPQLKATLCKRGANRTEAEDLLADLWADCFGSSGPPLLQKYEGRCALSSWLTTVATNRLIDFKRRESFRAEMPGEKLNTSGTIEREMGIDSRGRPDNALVALLRQAVLNAFAAEPPETLLMLKLVHAHQITQREICRIWNWHESKVSRTLESARDRVRSAVLAELHRADPWLTLEWDDFVELSSCAPELLGLGESQNNVQERIGL